MEISTSILPLFFAVIGLFVVAGFAKTALQWALNQRLRRYHHGVWSSMETSEYFPFHGLPVMGFVVSRKYKTVQDKRVQQLGAALLLLHRGMPVIWFLGIAVLVTWVWLRLTGRQDG